MPKAKKTLVPAAPGRAVSQAKIVAAANVWREQYNPLRGLTLQRAVSLYDAYNRGELSDLEWTFQYIEGTDPDLFALVERRTSAIQQMDWNINIVPEKKRRKNFDKVLAEEQQAFLCEVYDQIDNLYEAIEHLSMSSFRAFSLIEKHGEDSERIPEPDKITHLEILNHWNVVRNGSFGQWKYNPQARQTGFHGLPDENILDLDNWMVRENRRHIDRIALFKFIRDNLSNKDWDAFIEIYGIPATIVIGPPNVPTDREPEYQAAGERVAQGSSGYVPNGTEIHTSDSPRGNNPFRDRLTFLSEKLILAGTGGMLTMLAAPGSGTLAGSAHTETFKTIAKGEARKISECYQRGIDKAALAYRYPGKPVLAYFQLAANEETNVADIVDHAASLSRVFRVDSAEFSAKTGYNLQDKEQADSTAPGKPSKPPGKKREKITNRAFNAAMETLEEKALAAYDDGQTKALEPIITRLKDILAIKDFDEQKTALKKLSGELPKFAARFSKKSKPVQALFQAMASAIAHGIERGKKESE